MNHQDELTRALNRELHDRADGLHGAPISLADVKGTAAAIRRRRTMTTIAGTAAAAALVVPTLLFAGGGLTDSQQPPPAETPPVQPTPTPDDDPVVPTGGALETADLPSGDAPGITWVDGDRVLHSPDGATVRLQARYHRVVRWDDGWLGLRDGRAHLIGADGDETGTSWATGQTVETGDDGDTVLLLADGELRVHDNDTGADTVLVADLPPATEPVGLTDDGTAFYNITGNDGETTAWTVDGTGEPEAHPDVLAWTDVAGSGRALALTEIQDTGSCSAVVSPAGETTADTCEVSFDALSPDEEHVLAGPAYRSGYGDGVLAVLPVDGGEPLVEFVQRAADDATFMGSVWEDDEHVLVVTATPIEGTARKTWQVVRVGLDGIVENAAGPVTAGEFAFSFLLTP